jgi:hypothetical protein
MKPGAFLESEGKFSVTPAKVGIQESQAFLDSRLRGSDDLEDLLRLYVTSSFEIRCSIFGIGL